MTTGGDTVEKVCPMCAEHIQQLALVCKHCGYDYTNHSAKGTTTKNNGLAIASMVLGIVWVYWIGSFLAIIFGHVALRQIKNSNGTQTGRGMAIAGLVLGYMGLATILFFVLIVIIGASTTN